jgi:hypothetical protein
MGHDNNPDAACDDASCVAAVWSRQEVRLLKQAVKDFPADLDKNERFRSIAKAVGGSHNKKDCYGKLHGSCSAFGDLIPEHDAEIQLTIQCHYCVVVAVHPVFLLTEKYKELKAEKKTKLREAQDTADAAVQASQTVSVVARRKVHAIVVATMILELAARLLSLTAMQSLANSSSTYVYACVLQIEAAAVQPVRPQIVVRTTAADANSTREVLRPAWGSTSNAATGNRAQRLSVRGSSVSTICTEVSKHCCFSDQL